MDTINDRIKELINVLDLTNTAFAEKINVTQPYISKLTLKGNPSTRLIDDICQKFNVNKDWIISGKGEIFKPQEDKFAMYVSNIDDSDDNFIKNFIEVYMELDDASREVLKNIGKKMAEKYRVT